MMLASFLFYLFFFHFSVGSWHVEDVLVSTGLPPQVEGQLRCFCRLSVNQVTWDVPNTPDVTFVRIKWWGEPGEGAVFR